MHSPYYSLKCVDCQLINGFLRNGMEKISNPIRRAGADRDVFISGNREKGCAVL